MLDTSRFLDQVKLKGAIPTGRFSDSEILEVAYDVLLAEAQPFLISVREEYYVKKSLLAVTPNIATYPINSRALGLVLRELKLRKDNALVDLAQIDPEDIIDENTAAPHSFYMEGVNVVLYPTPDSTATLIQSYFQRINKPVTLAECALVTQIDTVTGIVTATPPTTWTTANTFDFISRLNGNDTLAIDLTASAVGTTSITFNTSDLPSTLAVGDYIALAGETPYIQVPDEAIPYVQHLVVASLLESMGDQNAMQLAMAKAERYKGALANIITQRTQGGGVKFFPQF